MDKDKLYLEAEYAIPFFEDKWLQVELYSCIFSLCLTESHQRSTRDFFFLEFRVPFLPE